MLKSYGWSDALQDDFTPYAADGLVPGRIVIQQRGGYRVVTGDGEIDARASGTLLKVLRDDERPAAGDWVALEARPGETLALVHAVLPRRTAFIRKASGTRGGAQVVAANVDVAFLVASLNADLNLRRLERYLATAYESGAEPVVVLTKADLAEDVAGPVAEVEAIAFGAPVLAISSKTGAGLDAIAARLPPGRTAVLLGSSGAGKSTLVNALFGAARMATREIREDDARGRHTTTHRELVLLPSGGLILDTPGMRELGLWNADEGVATAFDDVEALAGRCRFSDCRHQGEPGCAVRAAIEAGALAPERLAAYGKLQAELAYEHRREDPRAAQENRRLWASRHKAARAWTKQKRSGPDDG
ncbi:ribosome small subunit-dependent GTPase A [Phenylobacterium sp.]|uniref:ribosome small subunit-dependent GTPase A n=1 Tax=Phenylobacterium sp. TaxID=1871053 RepID=UPI0025D583C7|nr:ribosome small subunit-dependent GTPase A [Phenylobacterium sp.]MBX3486190.1 ribosome small subunit-dependent GTPase A [Phenylobacterium sp.]MCW5759105.1 ribosome small subunit-dependent GTPase A [Phenylobacterium sp.]